ncbi:hypothetical protein A2U01_0057563, partial [Trifolium medium]|nr:hypothetical protein [Trifolium medium]
MIGLTIRTTAATSSVGGQCRWPVAADLAVLAAMCGLGVVFDGVVVVVGGAEVV